MKEKPGTEVLEAKVVITEGKFYSVSIENNKKMRVINAQQLLSSVVNNLNHRPFTSSSEN